MTDQEYKEIIKKENIKLLEEQIKSQKKYQKALDIFIEVFPKILNENILTDEILNKLKGE